MCSSRVRLLIDILHPAHVHIFRNLVNELQARGHEVRLTMRDKDVARELLDEYGFSYEILSRQQSGLALAGEFLQRNARLWQVIERFRPHFLAGAMGPSIASVGRLRRLLCGDRVRIVVFYDTERAPLTNTFVYPLADYVCTADCYYGPVRGNHLTYPGYQQLAYLHPNRFTPDPEVVRNAGVDPTSPYYVVRFVSYQASHDLSTMGLSDEKKLELVRMLSEHGRVLVTSERALPAALEPYRMRLPANRVHHVLAFARLLVGESATMASEAAVLGVPAVYISPQGRGFTDDQERRYGLVTNFTERRFHENWMSTVSALASDGTLAERAREARARLLSEKIDVTAWMIELFEREYEATFGKSSD